MQLFTAQRDGEEHSLPVSEFGGLQGNKEARRACSGVGKEEEGRSGTSSSQSHHTHCRTAQASKTVQLEVERLETREKVSGSAKGVFGGFSSSPATRQVLVASSCHGQTAASTHQAPSTGGCELRQGPKRLAGRSQRLMSFRAQPELLV